MWVDKEIPLSVPEQWKQYKDTPYFVSDQGRVKRIYKNGRISYLTPVVRGGGNKECNSVRVKIYENYRTLNKVVWETFRGEVPEGYIVANKGGYSKINDLYSLELITIRETNRYSQRPTSKKVIDLKTGWVYPSCRDLARRLKKPHSTVQSWCEHKFIHSPKRFEYYDENRKYPMIVRFAKRRIKNDKNG